MAIANISDTLINSMVEKRLKTPDFGPMRHIAILIPEGSMRNCNQLSGQKGKDRTRSK